MTLRSVDPALGRVNMGEQCKLLTGGVLNGPNIALYAISTLEIFRNTSWVLCGGTVVSNNQIRLEF